MSETQDKLNWLAFRYVANELDAVEASAFESLLTTDQAAREAVASAVEETIQIRQALANPAVVTAASQRSNWSREATRVAVVSVGCCLTLILALCLVRSSMPVTGTVANQTIESNSSVPPAQLAYAWAEARDGLAELQPAINVEFADTFDSVLNGAIDAESEQSLVAPSWMLAALSKMDGETGSEIDIQE
ncbi:MAG: hypothetical protein O3C40_10120 [Planctomycetota bacterium]|nr:hypothetical protein [Planctomycetota bacterium]